MQSNAAGMLDNVNCASDYLYACDIPRSRYDVCVAPCPLTEGKCVLMSVSKDSSFHGFYYYDSALVRQHFGRSKGRSYARALRTVLLCYTSSAHSGGGGGGSLVQSVPLELMLLILAFFGRTTIVRPMCIPGGVVKFTLDMNLVVHGPIIKTCDATPIPRIVVRDILRLMDNELVDMHNRVNNTRWPVRPRANTVARPFDDNYVYMRRVLAIAQRDLVHHLSLELSHLTSITAPCRGSEAKYQITVGPLEPGYGTQLFIYFGRPTIAILHLDTAVDGGVVSCSFAVPLDK